MWCDLFSDGCFQNNVPESRIQSLVSIPENGPLARPDYHRFSGVLLACFST